MNVVLCAILAAAIVVASFLVGGRYTVVISDHAISDNAQSTPYEIGVFVVDRFSGPSRAAPSPLVKR
jgi:hypothetical protein